MRVFNGVLACIGVGAVSIVLADPAEAPKISAAPAATGTQSSMPTSPAPAAAPATPVAPAAVAATITTSAPAEESEQLDRHFLAEGYKTEMHGSQKVYCRKEETIGTRLGTVKNCGTVDQLKQREDLAAQAAHTMQRSSQRPGN